MFRYYILGINVTLLMQSFQDKGTNMNNNQQRPRTGGHFGMNIFKPITGQVSWQVLYHVTIKCGSYKALEEQE